MWGDLRNRCACQAVAGLIETSRSGASGRHKADDIPSWQLARISKSPRIFRSQPREGTPRVVHICSRTLYKASIGVYIGCTAIKGSIAVGPHITILHPTVIMFLRHRGHRSRAVHAFSFPRAQPRKHAWTKLANHSDDDSHPSGVHPSEMVGKVLKSIKVSKLHPTVTIHFEDRSSFQIRVDGYNPVHPGCPRP